MTIQTSSNKTIAFGDGTTTQFAFSFIGVAAAYVSVIFTDASGNATVLAQGSGATQYQISFNSKPPGAIWAVGGVITYNPSGTPIPVGSSLTIFRTLPLTQKNSLQNQNSLSTMGDGAETALDTIEMQLQQVSENINRAIVAPLVDPATVNLVMPSAAQRANTGLAFDGQGNVIAGTTPATGLISTAMQPVVDAASLAVGRAAFGLGNVATQNIGSGLQNDGAGNVRVNSPVVQVATNQAVNASFDLNRYVATGPINFTLARANTLFNGFSFWVEALTGDVTLVLDSHDSVDGGLGSGVSYTIPAGAQVKVTTDGAAAGTWYIDGMPWLVQNARNASGTYNISASDNAKILNHNSGAFGTFIFPGAGSLPANFRCLIVNGETSAIGKGVGGTNLGSFTMYPGQSYLVINKNGTIYVVGGKQLYVVNSVALFCNQGSGSDDPLVADGLADGSRARVTQLGVRNQLYRDFDHNGSQPVVTLTGSFLENLTFAGQPINCGVFFWNGSAPGAYTVRQVSGFCWIIGDGAVLECANVFWEGNGNTAVAIQMHQTAILDILSGCTFGNFNVGSHISSDGAGFSCNIDAGYTISNAGNAAVHWNMGGVGILTVTGNITITINGGPSPTMAQWVRANGSVVVSMASGVVFSGGPATGCQQWAIGPGAWLSRSSNTIPGSVAGNPTPASSPTGATGWVT